MPPEKTRIAASSAVQEGQLLRTEAGEKRILVSRVDGRICAVMDRCPHMGLSLARGRIENGVITCPWHNSRFEFRTGRNLDWATAVLGVPVPRWAHKALAMGKAPAPLQTIGVEEVGGEVFVSI